MNDATRDTGSTHQHPTLERLEDQIVWYDRKSQIAEWRYKALKLAQVIVAALIPLVSLVPNAHPQWGTAVLGLLVLIIEAVQQLNQDHRNWIAFRSTCEALKHEKFLFLAGARPYAHPDTAVGLLAERVEGLISQEHGKWVSVQEQAAAKERMAASGRGAKRAATSSRSEGT
jgi:hypothetical protein